MKVKLRITDRTHRLCQKGDSSQQCQSGAYRFGASGMCSLNQLAFLIIDLQIAQILCQS